MCKVVQDTWLRLRASNRVKPRNIFFFFFLWGQREGRVKRRNQTLTSCIFEHQGKIWKDIKMLIEDWEEERSRESYLLLYILVLEYCLWINFGE